MFVSGRGVEASPVTPLRELKSTSGPLVHFPADQAAHTGSQNEWWYVVGHLTSGGRTFGFETTLFSFHRVRAPGFGTPVTVFRTDVAITDEKGNRFLQGVRYAFPASASLSTSSLATRIGADSLSGPPGNMHLRASLSGGAIDLRLSSRRAPMYVGGRGYIPFGNGYTYYYSLTDLRSTGSLRLGGKTYRVSGMSWLDHQWGNWAWTAVSGWTWMALQLDNGVQLSVFDFRSTTQRVKAASVLLANGQLRTIAATSITPTGSWTSPHTGGRYPSGWIIRIPVLRATLRITPAVRDQELLTPGQPGGSYWEGSGRINGTFNGKSVRGLSYTELTGYARR